MVIPSLDSNTRNAYGSLSFAEIEEGGSNSQQLDETKTYSSAYNFINLSEGEVIDDISIVANTINALLGVSLFAMPWGYEQSGIIGGTIVLVVVGFLSLDTARMLLYAQKYFYHRNGEVSGYPELAAATLGPIWFYIVRCATIISCLGGCTGYLIFFGETVGQALSMEASTVILISTIPLILLSWIRSFRELTVFTVGGVIALIIAVISILFDGSYQMPKNGFHQIPLFETTTLINFVGPATFLFTIHYFVLSLGAENLRMKTSIIQHDDDETSHTTSAIDDDAHDLPYIHDSPLVFPISLSYTISVILIIITGGLGFIMYRDVLLVT
jgi:hypothetical protein